MNEEQVEIDFSGKSTEEVLSLFFHEIKSPVQIVAGHLSMLKIAELSQEDTQKFINIALKSALFIRDNVSQVLQYLDEQSKNQ